MNVLLARKPQAAACWYNCSRDSLMRSSKSIHIIQAHAEGEVGDVIVGGLAPPPGETLWEQSRFIATDQTLSNFVLNEPRGGVFRHVNLLVPPKNPKAQVGFIIMDSAMDYKYNPVWAPCVRQGSAHHVSLKT
jgi:hypothetical protein